MRYALIVLFLAGCAATPSEVKRDNQPIGPVTTTLPAAKVADCIARQWEDQGGSLLGQVISTGPEAYELRLRQGEYGVIGVYDVRLTGDRTRVVFWPRENYVFNASLQDLKNRVARCAKS